MKYFFVSAMLFSSTLFGQTVLKYDKRFVESEDRWVAFDAPKDSAHVYGFIYIDAMAGLTLNYEGTFTITEDGKFIPKKLENGIFKKRLQPNNLLVALIPPSKFAELQIKEVPDWLRNYKDTKDTIGRMVRWGYYYNDWGESAKALTYLEKAYLLDPHYEGLEFELSFAYNALEQYAKAIPVLEAAIKNKPTECFFYKELSYAEMSLDKLTQAAATCRKGLSLCDDEGMKAEIAHNMAYHYYLKKDKDNFKVWAEETKKWAKKDDQFSKKIASMEKSIND